MTDALIEVKNLTVRRGSDVLLSHVDLTVKSKEIITVVGPNGAGKTTLLRAAMGLTGIDEGSVLRRPGLTIGYVPQSLMIDPVLPLNVRRFLSLGVRTARGARASLMEEVNVPHLIDKPMSALSGGELRRVLLARALLREPDLLVLDEPVQGVDVGGQVEIYDLIARLRDRYGFGVLMVSHDLHLVMAATDHVVCLNQHVCCDGAPETVQQHPEYVALFGDRVASGFALYAHHHDHEHDAHGNVVSVGEGHAHGRGSPARHDDDHHDHG
jgi:zinc transport system ATP-binding protein